MNHNTLHNWPRGAGTLAGQELQRGDILKFEREWKGKKILQTRAGRKNENENGDGVEKGMKTPRRIHPNAKTTTCWELRVEKTATLKQYLLGLEKTRHQNKDAAGGSGVCAGYDSLVERGRSVSFLWLLTLLLRTATAH